MRSFTACLLLLPAAVLALDIVSPDPAVNARFVAGFPAAPQTNTDPSFVAHGIDLSGIGWVQREPTHAITLVTPESIVFANHQSVQAGDIVVFAAPNGSLKTGVIKTAAAAKLPGGAMSDLGVARLEAPMEGITPLAVGAFAQPGDVLGHCLLLYGHGPNGPLLGTNEVVDAVATGSGNPTYTYLSEGRITGMANGESGDSGAPSITVHEAQPVLLGVHLEVNQDTFISPLVPALTEIAGPNLKTVKLPPGR